MAQNSEEGTGVVAEERGREDERERERDSVCVWVREREWTGRREGSVVEVRRQVRREEQRH